MLPIAQFHLPSHGQVVETLPYSMNSSQVQEKSVETMINSVKGHRESVRGFWGSKSFAFFPLFVQPHTAVRSRTAILRQPLRLRPQRSHPTCRRSERKHKATLSDSQTLQISSVILQWFLWRRVSDSSAWQGLPNNLDPGGCLPSRTFLPESKAKEISQRILVVYMASVLGLSNSLELPQCFVWFRDSSPAWWMSLRADLRPPQVRVHAAPCLFNGCLGENSLTKLKGMETMGISCAVDMHILFTPNMLSSRSCDDYQNDISSVSGFRLVMRL